MDKNNRGIIVRRFKNGMMKNRKRTPSVEEVEIAIMNNRNKKKERE